MKTVEEIIAEISALEPSCIGFDTALQTDNTILSVGAHDALRWALGLAEQSISELLENE